MWNSNHIFRSNYFLAEADKIIDRLKEKCFESLMPGVKTFYAYF